MNKKAISILLVSSLLFGSGFQAFAEPLTEQQKQELKEKGDTFVQSNSRYAELQNKIDEIDAQIQPIASEIAENNSKIDSTNIEIEEAKKLLAESQKLLDEKGAIFDSRIRALYKSGAQQNYLALLLASSNLGELVSRINTLGKIFTLDKQIVDELIEKKEEHNKLLSSLENKVTSLKSLIEENEVKLDQLNIKKDEQMVFVLKAKEEFQKSEKDLATTEKELYRPFESIINNPNRTSTDLNNSISSLKDLLPVMKTSAVKTEVSNLINKARDLLNNLQNSNTLNRGDGASSVSDSTILSIAYTKLGSKYVFGATGPTQFDCSGFTQYVFRQAGISIGRDTYAQARNGTAISYGSLQPGDLVFTSPHHVGIYVGGGQMIHAPRTGDVVKVAKMWSFYTARRVK